MIAIVDYGMGNLRSVQKALEVSGAQTRIVTSPAEVAAADKLVLPGVGAIRPAMARLGELGLIDSLKAFTASGKHFLGICLGFQLLFETSSEGGAVNGLAILPGSVERFPDSVKVSQMGWKSLGITRDDSPMFAGVSDGAFVYFCHSYYVKPRDRDIQASMTEYGVTYASSVCAGNIWGVQFHPEKS
ncbi:MAG: imidazole glycerol phosphate synthase subunit HisH, partial [Candidatus Omnitrophota bacterium]